MMNKVCQIHGCNRKATVRGFCWPHYRQLRNRYAELYEHLETLYNDYGPLFERAVKQILASSRKHRRHPRRG